MDFGFQSGISGFQIGFLDFSLDSVDSVRDFFRDGPH